MKKCNSILVIDDEALVNLVNRSIIVQMGIAEEVKCLFNGEEGLNYLRILYQVNNPPDMVFVDLNMPVMSGFDFLKEFKNLAVEFIKDIKVIILTSSLDENDQEIALESGCDGYLSKPLSREKIMREYQKIFSFS